MKKEKDICASFVILPQTPEGMVSEDVLSA